MAKLFKNYGNKKVEKARRVLDDGGYVVVKNDGTVVPAPPEKKPFPKRAVAIGAGVGTLLVGGGLLAGRRLLGGAVVDPETVNAVSDAIGDVAAEIEADEAVEALTSVTEETIDVL